ncbi:zinc finger BED domain-containing protein 4-like [Styela clava]
MAGPSRSVVWKFFEVVKEDECKVKCELCGGIVSRGGKSSKSFTTSNLKKHLEIYHPKDFEAEKRRIREEEAKRHTGTSVETYFKRFQSESGETNRDRKSQLSVEEGFSRSKLWDINSSEAKVLHRLIGEMIATDCQPFSIVEDVGFKRLMGHTKPRYNIPSRKYFSETVIPSIYKSVREKVQMIVQHSENISFTSDIWTSINNTPFLSITAHTIDEHFQDNVIVLRTIHFPDSHTSANITNIIYQVLHEFHIPSYKVHVFARDNGSNMVRGIADTGYDALPCFLHTLQLVLKDSILEQDVIKELLEQCKRIVSHFSHSALANNKLTKLQKQHGLPQHKLLNSVPTRWNSIYLMLERMFEQKVAIANYVLDTPNLPTIDANKWNLMGKLVKLLEIFHKVTVRLSARSSTISEIIPQVKYIMHLLDVAISGPRFHGLGGTLTSFKTSAKLRFQKYMDSYNCILATFLDPRHKDVLFGAERLIETSKFHRGTIRQRLLETLEKRKLDAAIHTGESETSCSSGTESGSDNGNLPPREDDFSDLDFEKCYDCLVMETEDHATNKKSSRSESLTLFSEIERYVSCRRIEKDENPIYWCKQNKSIFPCLSSLANKYLSCPPSSVESERLFSIGGNIYTPHRNRLSPDTAEELMFSNHNLRYFEFQY